MIDKASADSLKPFVTQITGPLIRVVGERSIDVKTAIIHALNQCWSILCSITTRCHDIHMLA